MVVCVCVNGDIKGDMEREASVHQLAVDPQTPATVDFPLDTPVDLQQIQGIRLSLGSTFFSHDCTNWQCLVDHIIHILHSGKMVKFSIFVAQNLGIKIAMQVWECVSALIHYHGYHEALSPVIPWLYTNKNYFPL